MKCPRCKEGTVYLKVNEEGEEYSECDTCDWSMWGDARDYTDELLASDHE